MKKILKSIPCRIILAFVAICSCGMFLCQDNAFADKTIYAKFPVKTSDFSFVEMQSQGKIRCTCGVVPNYASLYHWVCEDGFTPGTYYSSTCNKNDLPEGYYSGTSPSGYEFNKFGKYSTDVWFSATVSDDWKIIGNDTSTGNITIKNTSKVAMLSFKVEGRSIKIRKGNKECASVDYVADGSKQFQDVMYDVRYAARETCLDVHHANTLSDWVEEHLNKKETFKRSELQSYLDQIPDQYTSDGDSHSVNTGVDGPEFQEEEPKLDPTGDGNNTAKTCESEAGTSLGWILCSVLKGAGQLAKTAYEKWIEPNLTLNAELLNDNSSGTLKAWEVFRNFANILFVILFLVVIFSQLTGVGIDNYGIKKILPKLIVAAILINLSYIICQVLVDLSNIIGSSVYRFLNSLGDQAIVLGEQAGGNGKQDSGLGGNVLVGGALLSIFAVGFVTIVSAGVVSGIIFPLILAVLAGVLALIFLLLILAIRKAGVILLVVLSPLAFACFMLPNTKSLFDKWKKTFTTLLIMYPLCGLLMGGGNLAGRILLSTNTNDFFLALTAMLASLAPIFAIPFVVKSSMQAFGSLGGKIAGLTGTGSRLAGKAKGTDFYKNARQRGGVKWKGRLTKPGSLGHKLLNSKVGKKLGGRGTMSRAQEALSKQNAGDVAAEQILLKHETDNDANAIDAHLEDTINRLKDKKNLSQQDKTQLHAAFATAFNNPVSRNKASQKFTSASATIQDAIADAINKDSDLGAKVNADTPWVSRFATYRQQGGSKDFNTWASSDKDETYTINGKEYTRQTGKSAIANLGAKDLINSKLGEMPEALRKHVTTETIQQVLDIDAKQNPDWQKNQKTINGFDNAPKGNPASPILRA